MYAKITKTNRKLFNTKHKTASGLLALNFPIIPQYNTLTLQHIEILLLKKNGFKKFMIHAYAIL